MSGDGWKIIFSDSEHPSALLWHLHFCNSATVYEFHELLNLKGILGGVAIRSCTRSSLSSRLEFLAELIITLQIELLCT